MSVPRRLWVAHHLARALGPIAWESISFGTSEAGPRSAQDVLVVQRIAAVAIEHEHVIATPPVHSARHPASRVPIGVPIRVPRTGFGTRRSPIRASIGPGDEGWYRIPESRRSSGGV